MAVYLVWELEGRILYYSFHYYQSILLLHYNFHYCHHSHLIHYNCHWSLHNRLKLR